MASEVIPQEDVQRHALRSIADALEAIAETLRQIDPAPRPPASGDVLERSLVDPLLTVAEVAEILRCSRAQVRANCRAGGLRAMWNGRSWRIRSSAVEAYVVRRTR